MNRTAHLTRLAGVLLAGGLVLSACSQGSDSTAASAASSHSDIGSTSGGDEQAGFNDADIAFAQGMLPHHQQALEMADMVDGRTENPQITDLATRIEAAQGPEIETLTGWLGDWGQEVPAGGGDMGGMDHGGGDGMMSAEDMDALEAASRAEFDRLFLSRMIEHHTGAIEMAQTEISDGRFPEAKRMATDIVDSQTAEMAEMEQLLAEFGP